MKAFVAAVALWSAVVLVLLFFDPGFQSPLVPCMGLVGHSASCEAAQQTVSDAAWHLHTLPLLLAIAAGYLAIVGLRLTRRARSSESG